MDDLMAVSSRQGKGTAATPARNKERLQANFAYRGAGFSFSSARNLAAAGEDGGLPSLPDS